MSVDFSEGLSLLISCSEIEPNLVSHKSYAHCGFATVLMFLFACLI